MLKYKLSEICKSIGTATPKAAEKIEISGIAPIKEAVRGHIAVITNPKYNRYLHSTGASAVVLSPGVKTPAHLPTLEVKDPQQAFLELLEMFNHRSVSDIASGIHPQAAIDPSARLGEGVSVGPFTSIAAGVTIGKGSTIGSCCVISKNSQIGENCLIYPQVTIMDGCTIGDRVIIHAGVVIGADGFGFHPLDGHLHKIPQIGGVIIGNDVEIGSSTCIDRSTIGNTIIEDGAKLDNLIQVGHNSKIGSRTVLAAQVGISGSTTIGKGVKIGGQAGFADHIEVGDGAAIGGQAGVTKSVPKGEFVLGYPARNYKQEFRTKALINRLPEWVDKIKALEQKIIELEEKK